MLIGCAHVSHDGDDYSLDVVGQTRPVFSTENM